MMMMMMMSRRIKVCLHWKHQSSGPSFVDNKKLNTFATFETALTSTQERKNMKCGNGHKSVWEQLSEVEAWQGWSEDLGVLSVDK